MNILNRHQMCKREEELFEDLLVYCSVARILWQLIFSPIQSGMGGALFYKRNPSELA